MILVHDIFICKPGNASKLAKMFKEAMTGAREVIQILTDFTGQFNRVVIVSQYEDLAQFEHQMKNYMQNEEEAKKMREIMKGYQELYISGTREVFQTW